MNPHVWGRIEPVELPLFDVVAKVGRMLPLVREDLVTAVQVASVLGEMHLGGTSTVPPQTRDTAATLDRSLRLTLAITLARLFEFGSNRRFKQDERDVASLPFLLRFLKEPELQAYYCNLAKDWGERSMADENERSAEAMFEQAFEALERLENNQIAVAALSDLDGFRDTVLAHTVMEDARDFYGRASLTFDMRMLVVHATEILSCLQIALSGVDGDFEAIAAHERHAARAFWQRALGTTA